MKCCSKMSLKPFEYLVLADFSALLFGLRLGLARGSQTKFVALLSRRFASTSGLNVNAPFINGHFPLALSQARVPFFSTIFALMLIRVLESCVHSNTQLAAVCSVLKCGEVKYFFVTVASQYCFLIRNSLVTLAALAACNFPFSVS